MTKKKIEKQQDEPIRIDINANTHIDGNVSGNVGEGNTSTHNCHESKEPLPNWFWFVAGAISFAVVFAAMAITVYFIAGIVK